MGGEAEIEYMAEEDFFLRCKIKSIFIQQWEWFSRKGEIDGIGGQGDIRRSDVLERWERMVSTTQGEELAFKRSRDKSSIVIGEHREQDIV